MNEAGDDAQTTRSQHDDMMMMFCLSSCCPVRQRLSVFWPLYSRLVSKSQYWKVRLYRKRLARWRRSPFHLSSSVFFLRVKSTNRYPFCKIFPRIFPSFFRCLCSSNHGGSQKHRGRPLDFVSHRGGRTLQTQSNTKHTGCRRQPSRRYCSISLQLLLLLLYRVDLRHKYVLLLLLLCCAAVVRSTEEPRKSQVFMRFGARHGLCKQASSHSKRHTRINIRILNFGG